MGLGFCAGSSYWWVQNVRTGIGVQERRKQDTRQGPAHKKGGNKPRQYPGRLFTHSAQPMRNWGRDLCARDKVLSVTTLGVPVHQTLDLARPSLKNHFWLQLVSPSPFFEFRPVSMFLALIIIIRFSNFTYGYIPKITESQDQKILVFKCS